MTELVTLSFEGGDCGRGFPAVTVRLWEATGTPPVKTVGALPAAPELVAGYRSWKLLYLALHQRLDWSGRIKVAEADVTNVSVVEFQTVCQHLTHQFNDWLHSPDFRPIDQRLRTLLNPAEPVRIIIETGDRLLARLPWHQWQLLDDFPLAEIALSTASYQRSPQLPIAPAADRVKILAVLGCSAGIDLEADRQYLTHLSQSADVTVLVEPSLETLHHHLWNGCQLLFFAGHSSSEETGVLHLSRDRTLTIDQVRYALKGAIQQGLQLAIFNSCDGLALAEALAGLSIPQVIVMREPVPDPVAQAFLKTFLAAFTTGQSLYAAVRRGREQLQALEADFPCASWLPMICQNPAERSCTWADWTAPPMAALSPERTAPSPVPLPATIPGRSRRPPDWLAIALGVTALVSGLRGLGWLQPLELPAFDYLMQLRPEEPSDARLLVIAVEESDFQLPVQGDRKGSLSDAALQAIFDEILPLEPRLIALDIYRDFPAETLGPLATQLRDTDNFFAICKGSDPALDYPGIAPPPEVSLPRQGFSDVVKDADTILRRHLLALNPSPGSPCPTPYALSTQLALHYLAQEGITAQFTDDHELQVGGVTLPPLRSRPGPYARTDLWGHQILLNYRSHQSPDQIAPVVSLAAVLRGELQAEDVRDRIVLIGVTAPSAEDFITTPYRTNSGDRLVMPGVLLQAQMVSQLLSAVQDGRPLLQFWPRWADLLWLAGWAMVGSALPLVAQSWWGRGLASIAVLLLLSLLCYGLLIFGWWVPWVPAAIALVLTGSSGAIRQSRPDSSRSNVLKP